MPKRMGRSLIPRSTAPKPEVRAPLKRSRQHRPVWPGPNAQARLPVHEITSRLSLAVRCRWTYLLSSFLGVPVVLRIDSTSTVSGVCISVIACAKPQVVQGVRYLLTMRIISPTDPLVEHRFGSERISREENPL